MAILRGHLGKWAISRGHFPEMGHCSWPFFQEWAIVHGHFDAASFRVSIPELQRARC